MDVRNVYQIAPREKASSSGLQVPATMTMAVSLCGDSPQTKNLFSRFGNTNPALIMSHAFPHGAGAQTGALGQTCQWRIKPELRFLAVDDDLGVWKDRAVGCPQAAEMIVMKMRHEHCIDFTA